MFTGCLKKGTVGNIEIWKDCITKKWFGYDTVTKQTSKDYDSEEELRKTIKKK